MCALQTIIDWSLDVQIERPGSVHRVVARSRQPVEGIVIELEAEFLVV
jgi:hypothetical protein